ncbi:MAG: ferredoxin [Sphingomonadaceae bacterium]|nr:ferredoxin [Sphingomonadaceae bacterium]
MKPTTSSTTPSLRIHVDRKSCYGHALCVFKGPEVFELDDEGYCISDGILVPEGQEEQARASAEACPERCITIIEETASNDSSED